AAEEPRRVVEPNHLQQTGAACSLSGVGSSLARPRLLSWVIRSAETPGMADRASTGLALRPRSPFSEVSQNAYSLGAWPEPAAGPLGSPRPPGAPPPVSPGPGGAGNSGAAVHLDPAQPHELDAHRAGAPRQRPDLLHGKHQRPDCRPRRGP